MSYDWEKNEWQTIDGKLFRNSDEAMGHELNIISKKVHYADRDGDELTILDRSRAWFICADEDGMVEFRTIVLHDGMMTRAVERAIERAQIRHTSVAIVWDE